MNTEVNSKFFPAILLLVLLGSIAQAQNVGIGTSTPQEKLHVAGNVRIDPLAGSGQRVTIANSQGTIQVVPVGNNGDLLTQQPAGPQWQPMPNSSTSSVSNCTTPPCPSMLSTTSLGTMTWGTCMRYCETLGQSGFSDWRTPSLEEMIYYFPQTTSEVATIWTNAIRDIPTASGEFMFIELVDGRYNPQIATNSLTCKCKCVR